MVLCVHLPDLELLVACQGQRHALEQPVALAPLPGEPQLLGSTSGPAQRQGVHAGMGMGEALARCPELRLVNSSPVEADALWSSALSCVEELGAAVEPGPPGEAYLDSKGLLPLYGSVERLIKSVRGALLSVAQDIFRDSSLRMGLADGAFPARIAAGTSQRAESSQHLRTRASMTGASEVISSAESFLAPLPIRFLHLGIDRELRLQRGLQVDTESRKRESFTLVRELERLGIVHLGDLAGIHPSLIADRFGHLGIQARKLSQGISAQVRPRTPTETLQTTLDLPDSVDGYLLENALKLLVSRFLALPGRQGRSFRSVVLSIVLSGGGSWRHRAVFNTPASTPDLLTMVLTPKLVELPGPASSMTLASDQLGRPEPPQETLVAQPQDARRNRIDEAIRQTRAVAGQDSVLRVMTLNSEARLPEERAILSPRDPRECG